MAFSFPRYPRARLAVPFSVALALALVRPGVAQASVLPPAQTTTVQVQAATTNGVRVPAVPKALVHEGPAKVFTPVPHGTGGLPQPDSPPTQPGSAGAVGPAAPCDFRFFMNNTVSPAGASLSSTTEPNVAVHGDGVLYTGNWYAARSSDSGMSWARYDPYAFFPASDGGFCCDQRALFVRNPDMVIWLLEYGYSATTQQGRLRVAFTRTQADLKNDTFYYFDLTPGTFGLPAGRFLDFSDIGYSNGHLYGSAIIASPPATAQGLVLWRARLFDIWDLGNVGLGFYTSATLGGFGSYRFAQGASDPMYWAAHTSTTNLRVFSWADGAGAANLYDRTVATWSGTPTAAPGPDGRDWTGFGYTVNTVLSGYVQFGEVGFLWTSGAVTNRPQTFVRVARLRTSDLAVIAQHDIWNPSFAFHFPSCAVNAAGEVGGTLAYGGTDRYPSTTAFLVDQCSPNWAPLTNAAFAIGARGPASNRWGDYLGAGRHSVVTTTFVGSGYSLDSSGNPVPQFVWFGRERDEPGWVEAAVEAVDTGGTVALQAAMTVAQTDRLGRKDGVTQFSRSYPPRQALAIAAAVTAQSSTGAPYRFERWIYEGVPQPVGVLTLNVGDLGTGPRTVTARAVYRPSAHTVAYGPGCPGSSVSFYERFGPGTFDLGGAPTNSIKLTPSGTGYAVTAGSNTLVQPRTAGLALTDDSLSAPLALPGAGLVFPGGSTTQIRICSNGFVWLNGTATSTDYTPTPAELLTQGPRLCPMWGDLIPDGTTNVNNCFYEVIGSKAYCTWRNVPEYGSGGSPANTLQVCIDTANHSIEFTWGTAGLTGSGHDMLTGFSPGASNRDPGTRDLSRSLPFQTQSDRDGLTQASTRPILGTTATLTVTGIPSGSVAGAEVIGGVLNPGLDLAPMNMPGCFLHVLPTYTTLPFAAGGTSATTFLPIPAAANLTGAVLAVTAFTISPGVNGAGAATSNGVQLTLGGN